MVSIGSRRSRREYRPGAPTTRPQRRLGRRIPTKVGTKRRATKRSATRRTPRSTGDVEVDRAADGDGLCASRKRRRCSFRSRRARPKPTTATRSSTTSPRSRTRSRHRSMRSAPGSAAMWKVRTSPAARLRARHIEGLTVIGRPARRVKKHHRQEDEKDLDTCIRTRRTRGSRAGHPRRIRRSRSVPRDEQWPCCDWRSVAGPDLRISAVPSPRTTRAPRSDARYRDPFRPLGDDVFHFGRAGLADHGEASMWPCS